MLYECISLILKHPSHVLLHAKNQQPFVFHTFKEVFLSVYCCNSEIDIILKHLCYVGGVVMFCAYVEHDSFLDLFMVFYTAFGIFSVCMMKFCLVFMHNVGHSICFGNINIY